jgi:hypothetical protein
VGQVDNLRADWQSAPTVRVTTRAQDAVRISLELSDSQGLGKSAETARKSACATRRKTILIRGN